MTRLSGCCLLYTSGAPISKAQGDKDHRDGAADGGQQRMVAVLHHAEARLCEAEALEEPHQNGGEEDDRTGPLDEGPAPLPGGPEHVARGGGCLLYTSRCV